MGQQKQLLLATLLVCCCAAARGDVSCAGEAAQMSGFWCEQLAPNFILGHRFNTTTDSMHFVVVADNPSSYTLPLDWVGVGISELGSMKGSAIVTLTQSAMGAWSLQDRFATGFTRPAVTDSSGAVLHSVQAAGNVLRATFSRPLESCSAPSVRINLGLRNQVIFAFGTSGTRQFSYHGPENRGFTTVVFRADANAGVPTSAISSSEAASEPGEVTFDVRMPPTPIRQVDDQFDCIDVELPQDMPRHLIRWEGLLEGAPQNVHHMVIFACSSKPSTFGKGAYSCPGMPFECMEFVTTWTPGAGIQGTPPEAGIRIGPGGNRYVALQMHFNNVARLQNQVDMSGFRLTLTSTLRQHDAGSLLLGNIMFSLPPNTPSVGFGTSWCPSSCTSRFAHPINVFSVNMHMHQVGSQIAVRHLRGKQELRPFSVVNHFDFQHQSALPVPPETALFLPGDVVTTECIYDTTGRGNRTRFGEGTLNEMCFAFLAFYPKLPSIDVCITGGNQSVVPLFSTCTLLSNFTSAGDLVGSALSMTPGTNNVTLAPSQIAVGTRYTYTPYSLSGSGCLARQAAARASAQSSNATASNVNATVAGAAGRLMRKRHVARRRRWLL